MTETARLAASSRVCAFPGCGLPLHGRGHCKGHYTQLHLGQPLRRLWQGKRPETHKPPRPCSFLGCENNARSRGLCGGHSRQRQNGLELKPLNKDYADRFRQRPDSPRAEVMRAIRDLRDQGVPAGNRAVARHLGMPLGTVQKAIRQLRQAGIALGELDGRRTVPRAISDFVAEHCRDRTVKSSEIARLMELAGLPVPPLRSIRYQMAAARRQRSAAQLAINTKSRRAVQAP
jgi:DNA-binding transcriptional ArsR family regulator